jgi:hypothetical protein
MAAIYKLKDLFDGIDIKPRKLNFVIEYSKDFNPGRAAVASGFQPDSGYAMLKEESVKQVLDIILANRLEASHIDAEWVLMEAVDNHLMARQANNLSASNTALKLIAQHTMVDAMASDKLNMNIQGDKQIIERLMRGRKRRAEAVDDDGVPDFS